MFTARPIGLASFWALGLALLAVFAAPALGGQPPDDGSGARQMTNPVPADARSIDQGRRLYQRYCRACHGEGASGGSPLAPQDVTPPSLADAEWQYGASDGEIFVNIRDGIGPRFAMKPMKSRMTPAEIWQIVNYLRSLAVTSSRPDS
jgi:mono/diheme cytochrome c family protein